MPLRPFSSPLAVRLQKAFHTSAICRDASTQPNHYEILQIPTDASPSEVKKSFYLLSKKNHPDLNPTDPQASKRFVLISEAYATLSSPQKRSQYDSTHLPRSQQAHSPSRPQGSYSSSQAGGRPASGLSRRRTQFRGPPSFYRSGGWGAHSEKRKEAQGNGAPGAQAPNDNGMGHGMGGMGYGQGWQGEEVRHFDRREHLRTQENHDRRQRARRSDPWVQVEEGVNNRGTLGNFLFVGGTILLGVSVPLMLAGQVLGGEKVEGKKKKRDEV